MLWEGSRWKLTMHPGQMWNGDELVRRSTRGVDQRGLGGAVKAWVLDMPVECFLFDFGTKRALLA